MSIILTSQLVSSPACIPQMTLEEILPVYTDLGFRKFEAFSSWCVSHLDLQQDPQKYLAIAARYGMSFCQPQVEMSGISPKLKCPVHALAF